MLPRTVLAMLTLILVAMLVACGSDDSIGDQIFSGDSDSGDSQDYEMDEPAADSSVADESGDVSGSSPSQIQVPNQDRRVIRSGELELYVSDVSAAVRHARDAVADRGGYVASSTARALSEDDERSDVTFEVPADEFEAIMGLLRDSSHVVRVEHESTSSQDVTEEYVDLRSQLSNLESTEARFVELLEDAYSISDVLSVESEVSRVRGEIERIQGRINYLEQRTDFSRIYVSFGLDDEDAVTVAGQHFTPGETAREAWNASMQFVGTVGNAVIAVAVFFWWAWPLLGLAALWFTYYRRRRQVVANAG